MNENITHYSKGGHQCVPKVKNPIRVCSVTSSSNHKSMHPQKPNKPSSPESNRGAERRTPSARQLALAGIDASGAHRTRCAVIHSVFCFLAAGSPSSSASLRCIYASSITSLCLVPKKTRTDRNARDQQGVASHCKFITFFLLNQNHEETV